jgi:hypothetical protein
MGASGFVSRAWLGRFGGMFSDRASRFEMVERAPGAAPRRGLDGLDVPGQPYRQTTAPGRFSPGSFHYSQAHGLSQPPLFSVVKDRGAGNVVAAPG